MVREFMDFGAVVDVVDPYASPLAVEQEYGIELKEQPGKDYDAIVVAVAHKDYILLDENYFISLSNEKAVLGDIKGLYRHKIKNMAYWSL